MCIAGSFLAHFTTMCEPSVRPAIDLSHFTFCGFFTSVFAKHTMKYETLPIHFSHFLRISCFINAAKKETTKFFNFSCECRPWCEMLQNTKSKKKKKKKRSAKLEKSDAKYSTIHFSFFTIIDCFHVFCGKCTADLITN